MKANLLVGEDTQLAWQLHTIHADGNSHWKVGDSPHRIPAILGPAPIESFVVCWSQDPLPERLEGNQPDISAKQQRSSCSMWTAVAKHDLLLEPDSIATITVVS